MTRNFTKMFLIQDEKVVETDKMGNNQDMNITEDFTTLDRYFRAANYLSVAQLYLRDNPLLERP